MDTYAHLCKFTHLQIVLQETEEESLTTAGVRTGSEKP